MNLQVYRQNPDQRRRFDIAETIALEKNPPRHIRCLIMIPTIHQPDLNTEILTQEGCWILESWNDASDGAVSLARARVAPGVTTERHCLLGVDERYLVVTGSGLMKTGTLPPTRVAPGHIIVIPAGISQQITNDGTSDLIFYCICTPRFSPGCYQALPEPNQ